MPTLAEVILCSDYSKFENDYKLLRRECLDVNKQLMLSARNLVAPVKCVTHQTSLNWGAQ